MGSVLYLAAVGGIESARIKEHFNAASFIEENAARYRLNSGTTVFVDKGNTGITYDFENTLVLIDGPGNADMVHGFDEYNRPDLTQRAEDIGCQIAEQLFTARDEFLTVAEGEEPREIPNDYAPSIKRATSFHQNYCLGSGA